ncbi:MAG: DEAD/DEAH box helicase family protein [Leptolyngbyaceae bacterium]|nr:DEAD/DEAH box helicase family protein [Leptolyngbyaceae bacterium]
MLNRNSIDRRSLESRNLPDISGPPSVPPMAFQNRNLAELDLAFQSHDRVLFIGGCGIGKTAVISGCTIRKYVEQGKTAWFLVDDLTLLDQSASEFRKKHGLRSNIVQGDRHRDPRCKVQIISIQTLASWMKTQKLSQLLHPPDLIIVDEAHTTCFRKQYEEIEQYCTGQIILLTATPCRTKSTESMAKWCDAVVQAPSRTEMVRLERTVPVRYFKFVPDADYKKLKTTGEDYQARLIDKIATKKATLDSTIEQTIKKAGDRITLVFCVTRHHADLFIGGLRLRGKIAEGRFGDTTKDERIEQNNRMWAGSLQFLVVVGCCIKGYDFPAIACISFTYATASEAKVKQARGRGERFCKDQIPGRPIKTDCLFLDFGGSIDRHKLTEDDAWDITDRSQSAIEIVQAKECPECNWLNLKSAKECIKCGQLFETNARITGNSNSDDEQESGVLVEVKQIERYWETDIYAELKANRIALFEKTKERVANGRNQGFDLSHAAYHVYKQFKLKDDWFPVHWYKGMLLGDSPSPEAVKEFLELLQKAYLPFSVNWLATLELGEDWEDVYGYLLEGLTNESKTVAR